MEMSITARANRRRQLPSFLRVVIAVSVALAAPAIYAVPGSIVDVELEGRLTTPEIDTLVEQLFDEGTAPLAVHEVDVYWIRFETTDLDGGPVAVRAQIFIPIVDDPLLVPLYVFGPGSTGLVGPCRPSREHVAGIRWGLYRTHVLAHAGQGVVGVLPDYVGFEDGDRIQPYFVAVSEGRLLLDAVRAAQEFFRANPSRAVPSPRAFVAGYSQGGHAAFAAADLRLTYAPELQLGGVIGYGATTDMRALFLEFVVSAPLVVHVYSELYGPEQFNPRVILKERWAAELALDATTQCIGGIQSYYPWNPSELFTPSFLRALENDDLEAAYPSIHRIMEMNSTGLSGHDVPALLLQGTEDIVVRVDSQRRFVNRLCESGSRVRLVVFEGERHDTRQISFHVVQEWMRDRIRSIVAPSDCARAILPQEDP